MNKITTIIIGLILIVVSFYGGTRYAQSKTNTSSASTVRNSQFATRGTRFNSGAGGFATGEIISKDDKSITLKIRDGGSKIIFVSSGTSVTKSVSGKIEDLKIGENIMVQGQNNSDGSITAESLQIRPATTTQQ